MVTVVVGHALFSVGALIKGDRGSAEFVFVPNCYRILIDAVFLGNYNGYMLLFFGGDFIGPEGFVRVDLLWGVLCQLLFVCHNWSPVIQGWCPVIIDEVFCSVKFFFFQSIFLRMLALYPVRILVSMVVFGYRTGLRARIGFVFFYATLTRF